MNSDFTSKDTSLWSSRTCTVLMASIKFSVDCSLCRDSSVSGFSIVVRYFDSSNHKIDWDSATCVTYNTNYYQRIDGKTHVLPHLVSIFFLQNKTKGA